MIIERAEIWSDIKANSGIHQSNIPKANILIANTAEDVEGGNELNMVVRYDTSYWADIQAKRVIRLIFEDGNVAEYRINKPVEQRAANGKLVASVQCFGILMDLANGLISRDETNGVVTMFYTLLSMTRTQLVTIIDAAAPSYFALGTVDGGSTVVETFTFNFDTPLKALQELATMEGLELAVRRNGDTNYLIDLLTQVGSTATEPEFRYRKNLKGVNRQRDGAKIANRLYAAGGSDGAVRLSLGEAAWIVNAVPTTTTVDLDGSPIYEDDVLNGMYLEDVSDSSRYQITDSDVTLQRITTGAVHGLSVGDVVKFRADTNGKQLPYVESQVSQATYGVIEAPHEENDLPLVDNLILNSAFRDWTTGDPDDWADVGTPTVTEETNALYTKVGGSSAKVVADADGEGISCSAVTIAPVDPNVFYSMFVSIQVESGDVEFYAEHSTEGRFPLAGGEESAFTSEHDRWIDLVIAGKEWPAGTVTLYVIARNGTATFYVDAAQLTNTAAAYPYFEGNAGRKLWQRSLTELDQRVQPVTRYSINIMDLFAANPTAFPYDEITLGGDVLVEDEELALQVQTRVVTLRRNLLLAKDTSLELSNKPIDLYDILTRRSRRIRQDTQLRPSIAQIANFIVSHADDGTVMLQVFGLGGTRSFKYIADTSVMPTFAEVIASGGDGIVSNTVDGTLVTVSEFRNTPSNNILGPAGRCFVRVVAFPILSAGGVPGSTAAGSTEPANYWQAEITNSEVLQYGDATSGDGKVTRSWQVDQRTTSLRVYRKEGGWPTIGGAQTGTLDPAYDRGNVDGRDGWEYTDGGYSGSDVVYDIAVAISINGNEAEREEYSYTVINTGTGDPRITAADRTQLDAGTNCDADKRSVRITWTLADCTDGNNDLEIFRVIDSGPEIFVTDITDPVTTTSYDDDEAPMYGGGSETRNCVYVLKLMDTGTTVLDTKQLDETHTGPIWNLCSTPE